MTIAARARAIGSTEPGGDSPSEIAGIAGELASDDVAPDGLPSNPRLATSISPIPIGTTIAADDHDFAPIPSGRRSGPVDSMTSYLQAAIARTRAQVAKSKSAWSEADLDEAIREAGDARRFFQALVERRGDSPFRIVGGIRLCDAAHGTDFEPLAMARRYQRAGASALALVEGETDDPSAARDAIAAIRSAVPLPLLHHRLVIDPHQIRESRAWGADAVLLVAEALTEGEVIDYQILASELAMTSVLLAHEEWNLLRTIRHVGFPHASGCLIAIDNRDPSTGDVDLTRSVRLAGLVEDRKILLSLHGIRESKDVATLRKCGFHLAMVSSEDGGDPVETTRLLLQGD